MPPGIIQRLVKFQQLFGLSQFTQKVFAGCDLSWRGVRLQPEFRRQSRRGLSAGLRFLVYQKKVFTLTGGEEGIAELKTIDLALNSELPAFTPYFGYVKGDADDHPAQAVIHAFQHGLKSLCDGLGCGHER